MHVYIYNNRISIRLCTDRNLATTINGSRGGGGGIATTYLSSVIISNRPRIIIIFQPTYYYYKKRYVEDLIGARSAVNGDPINDTKLLSKASRREIWKTFEISTRWLSEFPLVGQQLLEYRRLILRNTLIAALRGRREKEGGRSRNCRVRSRLAFRDRDKRWRKFPLSTRQLRDRPSVSTLERRSIGHAFVVCLLAPPFSTIDAKGNYRFPLCYVYTHALGSAYDKSIHEETMNHLPLGK